MRTGSFVRFLVLKENGESGRLPDMMASNILVVSCTKFSSLYRESGAAGN